MHVNVEDIICLKRLGDNSGIRFHREHDLLQRPKYFIDLSDFFLVLEVYPGVEVRYHAS